MSTKSKPSQDANPALSAEAGTATSSEVPAAAPPVRKDVDAWAREKATPVHFLVGAKVLHGWAKGRHVTEAEFDAALSAATNLRVGGSPSSQKKE